MNNLHNINSIIFDLGGVILNLSYQKTLDAFRSLRPDIKGEDFFGKKDQHPFFNEYEIGKISTETFISKFNDCYKTAFTHSQFRDCWNAMILDFPLVRIELLQNLKKQGYNLYLLSNINELHEHAVDESFNKLNLGMKLSNLFDKVYYSHHIHMRKPDASTFEFVLNENKLDKTKTLFIDDSLHHVQGARSVGINGIHLESGMTVERLEVFKDLRPVNF